MRISMLIVRGYPAVPARTGAGYEALERRAGRTPHGSIHDADSLSAGDGLVHIGPAQTGTTSLRRTLRASGGQGPGRRYAGDRALVRAVTDQLSAYSEDAPPPIREWHALAREIRAAREPRLLVSSEFFAWATPDIVRRVVNDLGPAGVHVAVTLRPLGRVIPSMWQQNVQTAASSVRPC